MVLTHTHTCREGCAGIYRELFHVVAARVQATRTTDTPGGDVFARLCEPYMQFAQTLGVVLFGPAYALGDVENMAWPDLDSARRSMAAMVQVRV